MKTMKTPWLVAAIAVALQPMVNLQYAVSQNVGINTTGATPNASALLDIDASPGNNKGLLIPRMTAAQRDGILSPARGLMVFVTNDSAFYYNNGAPTAPNWVRFMAGSAGGWAITGNAGTDSSTNFLGTTDAQPLRFMINNTQRMIVSSTGNIGVGTSSPASSAGLDVDFNNKGLLVPRMTTTQRDAIASPANSLLIFNTTTNCFEAYNATTFTWIAGFCIGCSVPSSVTATASPNPICAGSTLTLTGGATGATSWSWTGPNSFTSAVQSPTIASITTAGAGVYALTAGNACGWSSPVNTASVSVSQQPTTANAGLDINPACGVSTATLAGNTPTVGTGLWTVVSGTATITTPTSPTSGVTGLAVPGTATLRWTISNAPCADSFDEVVITTTACCPNVWAQKANFGGTARRYAVGFSIGTKGYIGTGNVSPTRSKEFWEWDQATNTWTQKADFGGDGREWAIGFSIGTKGYIGTGFTNGNTQDFWEWDQATNTWTQKANFGGVARDDAVGFSIGTKGYIGTGNDGGALQDFWEWDQASNTWTQKANFGGTARIYAVGFSIGTKGYIGTGSNTQDFWEWDQATNTWTQKANFGGTARSGAVGFSIGTKGYIGTGDDANPGYLQDFWEWCQ